MINCTIGPQVKLREMVTELLGRFEIEQGQDLIEYSLLAGLISIVSIAIMVTLGAQIAAVFPAIVNALKGA